MELRVCLKVPRAEINVEIYGWFTFTATFRVLRKCSNKFDCLIFEMFFIRDLKPKFNKQSDSIRAKLFA